MDGGVNQRSRSAAAEDDGAELGYDSPRSGIATPQPDLHDKRLPGIMSYFNQVRASSFQRLLSGSFKVGGQAATSSKPAIPRTEESIEATPESGLPLSPPEDDGEPPLLAHEMLGLSISSPPKAPAQAEARSLHACPTPPVSQPSSLHNFGGDSGSERPKNATPPASRTASPRHMSVSESGKGTPRRMSLLAPLTTSTINDSNVSASHLSNPAGRPSTIPNSPRCSQLNSSSGNLSYQSASMVHLMKLTDGSGYKSGASTPTRALSSTQHSDDSRHGNGISERIDRTATNTPTPAGARAPAPKGKLTIKIAEARGLKKCKDPYVVVVFQRSELISAGPRTTEDSDEAAIAAVAMGGLPIQRSGSDNGRPMAIPMRSRQSSNTSISDFNTFRNRNSRRSFTNPKWDAEAVL